MRSLSQWELHIWQYHNLHLQGSKLWYNTFIFYVASADKHWKSLVMSKVDCIKWISIIIRHLECLWVILPTINTPGASVGHSDNMMDHNCNPQLLNWSKLLTLKHQVRCTKHLISGIESGLECLTNVGWWWIVWASILIICGLVMLWCL